MRRQFIKSSLTLLIGLGLLVKNQLSHAARIAEYFSNETYQDSLNRLFKHQVITQTAQISVKLPAIAEDGAAVPITITSDLEDIQRIYILTEKNPTPLAAEFSLSAEAAVYINTRIKLAESSHVIVIAEQNGHFLKNQQWVNVVQGGCGTG